MPFWKGSNRRKLRVFALLIAVSFCILIGLRHAKEHHNNEIRTFDPSFDVIQARSKFHNYLIHDWLEPKENDGQMNCKKYWTQLMKTSPQELKNPQPDFVSDPRIYKKSKWMINAKKLLRRKLHDQGVRLTDAHIEELRAQFYRDSFSVSQLEEHFVSSIRHLRALGHCLTSDQMEASVLKSRKAKTIMSSLIPWLLQNDDPLYDLFTAKKEERGILFVIFGQSEVSKQIDRVARSIRILRSQGNVLPIQIAYSGESTISQDKMKILSTAATSDIKSEIVESASEELDFDMSANLPQQKLSFLDVRQFIDSKIHADENLTYFVAIIFSRFANVIVMTSQTIPMDSNLSSLFENEHYKSQGTFFFKDRPSLESKPEPFPPGFFEVNELVNQHAAVDARERNFFGLRSPKKTHTRRVTEMGFQRLLDPSMAVFNIPTVISGLLISSVLPFHTILNPKYEVSAKFNAELVWLGQELAANHDYVHFNKFFASAPGVLTPPENLVDGSFSRELCSSSWSQVSGDDEHLIYVTSHQLENRVLPQFKADVRAKLSVDSTSSVGKKERDDSLAQETINKNLLFINSILQPVSVEKPIINNQGQPFVPVEHISEFGSVNDYWCAYDVVGSVDSPNRGLVYEVKKRDQLRYLFYLDVWSQNPMRS